MAFKTRLLYDVLAETIDNRGKTPPLSPTGYPLVEIKHIQTDRIYPVFADTKFVDQHTWDTWFRGHLKPRDILFSTVGSIARSCLVPVSPVFCIAQNVLGFRVDASRADPRYVYYAINGSYFQHEVHGRTVETVQKSIKVHDLKTCRIPFPPLAEQRAIAHILGTLDDKIDLNRRMNETLEAMARALFKSWFVDFDPVRTKMDGRKPAGMDKATAALFPDEFQESDIGHIPKGWNCCRLREIAELLSGGTPKKSHDSFWHGNVPWISPKAMTQIHVDDSDEHVSEAAIGNGTRLVPKGTVLVMVRGMGLHQGVRISQAQRDVTFNQDVKAIIAKSVPAIFILYGCLDAAQVLLSNVHASGHGTGVLSTEFLDRLDFVVPPDHICDCLSQPLVALNSRIATNNLESRSLAALCDALLPKLLSGEVRVDDAERSIKEVG